LFSDLAGGQAFSPKFAQQSYAFLVPSHSKPLVALAPPLLDGESMLPFFTTAP
jgi:hypothetical protein